MHTSEVDRAFYREYDLASARQDVPSQHPAGHQSQALAKLYEWYESKPFPNAGGILVLPTGGGKTFTALRFLCRKPLSDGYRVLWLAHTHHLLEQAFFSFKKQVGEIAEPRCFLHTRVVSGAIGHFRVHSICPDDNVVFSTLQTIRHAQKEEHPALMEFMRQAHGRLFVVFDEAHHGPAPSYRNLVIDLRNNNKEMYVLGLTATPTYSDEVKQGWLAKLFPQKILYSVSPRQLMAAGILAKPVLEDPRTDFTPNFNDREYEQWVGTYRDIPEDIITQLAESRERNMAIAETYIKGQRRYGRTLIFTDRWYQCEQISEFLRKRGVTTATVYSHVGSDGRDAESRNRRRADDNAKALADFRAGQVDVLINVRMLTEGTDVPEVNTVFLTRPTTSAVLMTQMVGRALRGPKFGGTSEAYVVLFVDNWKQLINWAGYDQLAEGLADDTIPEYGKKPPIQWISISLVQRLARQMDSGINISAGPFLSFLPVGWYRVEFTAQIQDSDEQETVRKLIMVFDHEQAGYERLIEFLMGENLEELDREAIDVEQMSERVRQWNLRFFPETEPHFGSDLSTDPLSIARHIAQSKVAPVFFPYDEREKHDLDIIAHECLEKDLGPIAIDQMLRVEYNRVDRLWTSLYYTYPLFKSQLDACLNRLLDGTRQGADLDHHRPQIIVRKAEAEGTEISNEIRKQVLARDGGVCLCCDRRSTKSLNVDHISPRYFGGSNILDNLQTLCRECNTAKGIKTINFRDLQTDLTSPPSRFPEIKPLSGAKVGEPDEWAHFLRRSINLFYECRAVQRASIAKRGQYFHEWEIELVVGNDPEWLRPHLSNLLLRIRIAKENTGLGSPDSIVVKSPDRPDVIFPPDA